MPGCIGTPRSPVQAPSPTFKNPEKQNQAITCPPVPKRANTSAQPCSSPHAHPSSRRSRPHEAPGARPFQAGRLGLRHLPEQDLALLRGLGVKLDAGPPRKLPGWKRLLL